MPMNLDVVNYNPSQLVSAFTTPFLRKLSVKVRT